MDDAPPPAPLAAPGQLPPPPGVRAPHRPPQDPARAEAADRAYGALREFAELLPPEAKEHRLLFYRWNPRTGTKRSGSIGFMLMSRLKDTDLAENPHALEEYLREEYGPGFYRVEPSDEHSHKIDKLASWTVDARGDTMSDDDQDPVGDDRDRPRHRRTDTDTDMDTDTEVRDRTKKALSVADLMAELDNNDEDDDERGASVQMSMMQMMQMQAREERLSRQADEERRREERKEDERRSEALRRADEERRREERKQDEDRRREDREAQAKRDAERLTILTTAITGALGVIGPILARPKEDHLPLLLKAMEPRPVDPLLVKLLDNASNKDQQAAMFSGMAKVQELGTQAQAAAFTSVMNATNDLQSQLLKKAIAMNTGSGKGDDDDEGSTSALHDIAEIVTGATKLLPNGLGGVKAPAQALPAPVQPGPAQSQGQPIQAQVPRGVEAVVVGMMALQTHVAPNGHPMSGAEEASVEQYILNEMPEDLGNAIVTGDEKAVMSITQPIIVANPEYLQWIAKADVQSWVQNYFGHLRDKLQKEMEQVPVPVQPVQPAPVQPKASSTQVSPVKGPVAPTQPPPQSQNLPTTPPLGVPVVGKAKVEAGKVAAAGADPDAPV